MFTSFDKAHHDSGSIFDSGSLFRDSPHPIDSATDDDDRRPSTDSAASSHIDIFQPPTATTSSYATRSSNRKKTRSSMPERPATVAQQSSSSSKGKTTRSSRTSTGPSNADEDEHQSPSPPPVPKTKGKASHQAPLPGFTSCESCRRGKRRCEPSPLVPLDHPDVQKLPCARCRRFAIECIRVKTTRRKGPAPVAISDAQHGYSRDSSGDQPSHANGTGIAAAGVRETTDGNSILPHDSPINNVHTPSGLDQIVPGPTIEKIVNLFFDHVYPLSPCIHRPTFITDLAERRDQSDPVFFALALNVLAATLVQVPRVLMGIDKDEVEQLAKLCLRVSRAKMAVMWEEPTAVQLNFVVIAYLESIVHLFLGNNTAQVTATAQANQLALALHMHKEISYKDLNPVEGEMRRRMFWLLFQSDKMTSCLLSRPIYLRLDEVVDLQLPLEIDDEYISSNGVSPQPREQTSLISGFNVMTNLTRILNDVLFMRRRKTPRIVDEILFDLQRVDVFRAEVMRIYFDMPDQYKLRTAYDSRTAHPAQDWENKLYNKFVEFFNTGSDSAYTLNSFLVMQGNILVSRQSLRLLLLLTRQSLLRELAVFTPMTPHGMGYEETSEDIARELLDGLNSLPVECVATNGPLLVQKVRFVAVHLMDAANGGSGSEDNRAQTLLLQFLTVLSVIEGMYSFDKELTVPCLAGGGSTV
ncbi:hypothetical protein IAR50_001245 [Cryptococcus sp. DSM 104548]